MFGPGTVVATRFTLGPPLGVGGMGAVYVARDAATGDTVALKLMSAVDPTATRRFMMECSVLADLAHPGIVRHVAHGLAEDGTPYLAMERLEGEELDARLSRGPMQLADALELLRCVAGALAVAHARGVLHRDLKPSNVFLRDGEVRGATLLDFGIARRVGLGDGLTHTGRVVGTPDYMAPEQARGAAALGPAVDVFALGCVMYRCLTGQTPFGAEHVVATLARILLEEHAPVLALRPDLPPGVGRLIDDMLRKDPAERLPDAAAVLAALDALGPLAEGASTQRSVVNGLSAAELELVSVLLVGASPELSRSAHTWSDEDEAPASVAAIVAELGALGADAERLADGSVVATFGTRGAADQAVHAAICARRAASRWPGLCFAIATARRVAGASVPIGEAMERAARLVAARAPGQVLLDEVTASLVDGRVALRAPGGGPPALALADTTFDGTRPLLGKPTPCVGRDQEIGLLELSVAGALDEGQARAVLVVGPAGIGKSRVRHELLRRIARDEARVVTVLQGRGELLRAGTPFAVASDLLRRHFHVGPDDSPDVARARLREGTQGAGGEEVAELLGEICDLRFPDNPRLRALRQDPRSMQLRVGATFVAYLRALTDRAPLAIVLDDLHWGDRPSVDLVGLALRDLADRPLFVAAFARPEVHALAPNLWKDRVVELPLRPLSRRACEQLVRRVCGATIDDATVARVVAQSDGNALFLEELVRATAEGGGVAETVLAMLQSRIARLEPTLRRVLRAASVYGEGFDPADVRAVLGPATDAEDLLRWLGELVRHEVLERDALEVFRFRHALMRDAAHGLMVDTDRRLGHRLAAERLAERGDEPGLIAEHFLLAGRPEEAGPWFVRAADRAFERDDYVECRRLAARGRAAGASGEARGALAAVEAYAAVMVWDWGHAASILPEAFAEARPGGRHAVLACRTGGALHAYRNDVAGLRAIVERLLADTPDPDVRLAYSDSAVHLASNCIQVGLPPLGAALLDRAAAVSEALWPEYPGARAWHLMVRCTLIRHRDDSLDQQLVLLEEAQEAFALAGSPRLLTLMSNNVFGEVECRAGLAERGLRRLRASLAAAEADTTALALSHTRLALANALCADPAGHAEATTLARAILATTGISAGYEAMARDVLATVHLAAGQLDDAEREARAAIALSPHTPVRRWLMVAHLADALQRAGRVDEAAAEVDRALAEIDAYGGAGGYADRPLRAVAARVRAARG